jgi:hypothetical protein
MANVKKANRVQDTDIKRLNHMGLGLKAIADLLGCHAATITLRLTAMGISPTDTRRSFMEQVFKSLSPEEQDWLSHNLFTAGIGVKEFVTSLIREAYTANGAATIQAVPVAMPVMEGVPAGGVYEASAQPDPATQVPAEYVQNPPEVVPPLEKPKLNFT